jgi:hypothetical protein
MRLTSNIRKPSNIHPMVQGVVPILSFINYTSLPPISGKCGIRTPKKKRKRPTHHPWPPPMHGPLAYIGSLHRRSHLAPALAALPTTGNRPSISKEDAPSFRSASRPMWSEITAADLSQPVEGELSLQTCRTCASCRRSANRALGWATIGSSGDKFT